MTDIIQTLVSYLYTKDYEIPTHRWTLKLLKAEHADELRILGGTVASRPLREDTHNRLSAIARAFGVSAPHLTLREDTHNRLSAMEAKIEKRRMTILSMEYAQSGRIDAMVQYLKEDTP